MKKNIFLVVLAVAGVAEGVVIGINRFSRDSELVALQASKEAADQNYQKVCETWSTTVRMYGTFLVHDPPPEIAAEDQATLDALLGEPFLRACKVRDPKLSALLSDAHRCWIDTGRGDCYGPVATELEDKIPLYFR